MRQRASDTAKESKASWLEENTGAFMCRMKTHIQDIQGTTNTSKGLIQFKTGETIYIDLFYKVY